MSDKKTDQQLLVPQNYIDAARAAHGDDFGLFELTDDEENVLGAALFKVPDSFTLKAYIKNAPTDAIKARRILITGTLLDCPMKEEIKKCADNSKLFCACWDAASDMIPAGKARRVKI